MTEPTELPIDPAIIRGELEVLREIARQAGEAHDDMPLTVQIELERRSGDHEMLGLVPMLAMMSSNGLGRLAGTISAAVLLLAEYEEIAGGGQVTGRQRRLLEKLAKRPLKVVI